MTKGIILNQKDSVDKKLLEAVNGKGTVSKLYKLLFHTTYSITGGQPLSHSISYHKSMGKYFATFTLHFKLCEVQSYPVKTCI